MSTSSPPAARPDVTWTVRHGVPHVLVPAAGPVRARLLFRVGVADETVQDRGLTHLVEHLVMRAVGRRHFEVNGHTGVWTTGFEAVGTAEDVTGFVEDVWTALADLPTAALDLERAVLRHEASGHAVSPAVEAARHRFGLTGPGRLWTDELGLPGATEERVRDWVRERFVRPAAALASTADLTPDLAADLGTGSARPVPAPVTVRGGRGPVWVGDTGSTAVSLLLPTEDGTDLAVGRLLLDAAEQAVRHDHALAYEVSLDALPVTPTLTEVAVYAVCEPDQQAEVTRLLVAEVRRLRDTGPEAGTLALERRRSQHVWTHRFDELELASEAAGSLLLGRAPVTLADRLAAVDRLDAGAVMRAVRDAWPTLQVLLPVQEDPGMTDVPECRHDEPPVTGRVHRGNPLAHLLPGARVPLPLGASLTCGGEGLTLRLAGERQTVRWDEVAAVVRQQGALTVVGHDGTSVLLPDGTFLGGRRIRRAVESTVDPGLFVDAAD